MGDASGITKRMNSVLFKDAAQATKVKGHQSLKTDEQP